MHHHDAAREEPGCSMRAALNENFTCLTDGRDYGKRGEARSEIDPRTREERGELPKSRMKDTVDTIGKLQSS